MSPRTALSIIKFRNLLYFAMDKQSPAQPSQPQDVDMTKSIINKFVDGVSKDFDQVKPLLLLCKRLNIDTGKLVIPASILILVLVFSGIASGFLVTLLGFLYPAYMSFKALETKGSSDDG